MTFAGSRSLTESLRLHWLLHGCARSTQLPQVRCPEEGCPPVSTVFPGITRISIHSSEWGPVGTTVMQQVTIHLNLLSS